MSFAVAFILLTTLGTVLFLPLLAPLLIKGLTVDTWSLAKPLLMMVLLPLLIGGAIRLFAPNAAEKLFPVIKRRRACSPVMAPASQRGVTSPVSRVKTSRKGR